MRSTALALVAIGRGFEPPQSPQPTAEALPVDQWRRQVRAQAQDRWKKLMPQTFEHLLPESQADLVLSDLVYQGPIDDLGRSLGLIFASIERELRRVVGSSKKKGSLPTLRPLIEDCLASPRPGVQAIEVLLKPAQRIDGSPTKELIRLRNDIAHGNPLSLTRLDVDAVRRLLVLGPDPVLPMLAMLPSG